MHMIEQVDSTSYDLVSTDLFDTLLLRDLSLEVTRLNEAACLAARRLSLNPRVISAMRQSLHRTAYMAVAVERPSGDASLASIARTLARALGTGTGVEDTLRAAEVETDARHLSANRTLLSTLARLANIGKRIVATTDTYYSTNEIDDLLSRVLGEHPIAAVYASCDVGLTKHAGGLFSQVARREGVSPDRILHIGDDPRADVAQALAAGCHALHLPRSVPLRRAGKAIRHLAAFALHT